MSPGDPKPLSIDPRQVNQSQFDVEPSLQSIGAEVFCFLIIAKNDAALDLTSIEFIHSC